MTSWHRMFTTTLFIVAGAAVEICNHDMSEDCDLHKMIRTGATVRNVEHNLQITVFLSPPTNCQLSFFKSYSTSYFCDSCFKFRTLFRSDLWLAVYFLVCNSTTFYDFSVKSTSLLPGFCPTKIPSKNEPDTVTGETNSGFVHTSSTDNLVDEGFGDVILTADCAVPLSSASGSLP